MPALMSVPAGKRRAKDFTSRILDVAINVPGQMTKISELLGQGRTVSFELFPPRNAEGETRLEQTLHELGALRPSFMSITYGAAGSTRKRTHELVHKLLH